MWAVNWYIGSGVDQYIPYIQMTLSDVSNEETTESQITPITCSERSNNETISETSNEVSVGGQID